MTFLQIATKSDMWPQKAYVAHFRKIKKVKLTQHQCLS